MPNELRLEIHWHGTKIIIALTFSITRVYRVPNETLKYVFIFRFSFFTLAISHVRQSRQWSSDIFVFVFFFVFLDQIFFVETCER